MQVQEVDENLLLLSDARALWAQGVDLQVVGASHYAVDVVARARSNFQHVNRSARLLRLGQTYHPVAVHGLGVRRVLQPHGLEQQRLLDLQIQRVQPHRYHVPVYHALPLIARTAREKVEGWGQQPGRQPRQVEQQVVHDCIRVNVLVLVLVGFVQGMDILGAELRPGPQHRWQDRLVKLVVKLDSFDCEDDLVVVERFPLRI